MYFRGSYVELVLAIRLRENLPQKFLDLLEFMVSDTQKEIPEPPDNHPFFECTEWWKMLWDGDNAYFDGVPGAIFQRAKRCLTIRAYNKWNSDGILEKFVSWIAGYCSLSLYEADNDKIKFIGYIQSNERIHPTLIYLKDNEGKEEYELYFQELNLLQPYNPKYNSEIELANDRHNPD
jgi:hypothetical protein